MAVITTEFEVTSSLPAPKLFKAFYNDFDSIAPKADPQSFKSISVIEGDGGVGTIKIVTYGDAINTDAKIKIDVVDSSNLSFSYTIFEGSILLDIIDTITHHIKFTPSAAGGSVYKHTVVIKYKVGAKPQENLDNRIKESLKNVFKAIESYIIAHPN